MARRVGSGAMLTLASGVFTAVLSWPAAPRAAVDSAAVQRAFDRFLGAPDPEAAARLIAEVVATGVTFEDASMRLTQGRSYSQSAPRGLRRLTHRTSDGLEHEYVIIVPDDYSPSRAYQVRVQLHGGIARPSAEPGREGVERIVGSRDQIYVHPNGWFRAMWWQANQVDNIGGILDRLRRTYNVDENRVHLTGISDGGTGAYFFAFRDTTPWASFLPLNGQMTVLANPDSGVDGDIHSGNARNKPFFIVNGGRDPLYPTRTVEPFINHLRTIGTEVVYHPQPTAGHNTDWWPTEKDSFEQFVREHPRDPLPDRLSWETDRTDRYNRAHWLIIDGIGKVSGEPPLADTNIIEWVAGSRKITGEMFPRTTPPGRVDLVRSGNTVEASTRGVRAFTLLLSSNEFEFRAPIRVITNGHVAFEGKLERGVPTLLKWAARDNDRTMLFGAELKIRVK